MLECLLHRVDHACFVKLLSKSMVGHRFMSVVAAKVRLTLAASSEDIGCVMAAVCILTPPKNDKDSCPAIHA